MVRSIGGSWCRCVSATGLPGARVGSSLVLVADRDEAVARVRLGRIAPTAHRFALNVSYVHPGRLQEKEGLVHSLQRLQDVRMVCMV